MKKYFVLISFFAAIQASKAFEAHHDGEDIHRQIKNNNNSGMGEQSNSFRSIYLDPSLTPEELALQVEEYVRLHTEWTNKKLREASQQVTVQKPIIAPQVTPILVNNDDDDEGHIPYIPYVSSRKSSIYAHNNEGSDEDDIPYIPYVSSRKNYGQDKVNHSQLPDVKVLSKKDEQLVKVEKTIAIPTVVAQQTESTSFNLEEIYEKACDYVPTLIKAYNAEFPNNIITPLNIDNLTNLNIVAELLAKRMGIKFDDAFTIVEKINNPD